MMTPEQPRKLSLFDSIGMAIGGMVGGGIFAVMGVAATRAGPGAFLSFGFAGLLALITGVSYAKLTCSFDEPGGSFSYVEHIIGPRTAGTLSWFLILGYIFTISLYAYMFGEYLSEIVAPGQWWSQPLLGGVAIFGLTVLNLVGVRESGWTEDLLVYGKILILLFLAGAGLFYVEPSRAVPDIGRSAPTIVYTAALVFVGYEGFQLLTYDYDDIEDHHQTLPRGIIGSILVVTGLYMLIAFVTTGTLSAETIKQHSETVLAMLVEPMFGRVGFVLVVVAAVVSTASAINATIFAAARLGNRVADDCQLPGVLTARTSGGVPIVFTILMGGIAFLIQFTGSLDQIVEFSSLVFLFVFGVVNLSAVWHNEYEKRYLIFPVMGCLGCWISTGVLLFSFYREKPVILWMTIYVTLVLIFLRVVFVTMNQRFINRHCEVNLDE